MQVIENWTDVQGTVVSVNPHPALNGFAEIELEVKNVKPVTGFSNLLADSAGKTIKVSVAQSQADASGELLGRSVDVRIKRAGPDAVFAHPEMLMIS